METSRMGRPKGSRDVRWTRAMTERFLDHLAMTCNVAASAKAIEVAYMSVYAKRRGDAEFRAQWDEALDCGYQLLETRLVGHALAGGSASADLPGEPGEPILSADYAMRVLALRNGKAIGRRDHARRPALPTTKAETIGAIMRKLAVLEAAAARNKS